jgi:hypothetical protein
MGTLISAHAKIKMSKGSHRRPCDEVKVSARWPFKERKVKTWPRDKNGNLK